MSRSRLPLVVLMTAALVALGGCAFPGGDDGPDVTPSKAPPAAAPPAGTEDPAKDPALQKFYGQRLAWAACEDADAEGDECAAMTVPLDWSKPSGETIRIALLRHGATGTKLGSLVVNPGGPGVSGITYAKAAPQAFGRAVVDNYDVVGFDPRGVGQSAPVECLPNSQLDAYVSADGSPDSQAELDESVRDLRAFGQACERNTGPLLRHVDTLSVVKDMDVLRQALGEDRLTFHGASYGTYIGAWYAQTFPWRVGRFVLDGAVDPSLTAAQYVAGQAEGFSRALRAYVADCQKRECPLNGSLQDGLDRVGLLVDAADEDPLRTGTDRELTQSLMFTGIAQGLYDDQLWPSLTVGLEQALTGDGSGLLQLADLYLERDARGNFGQTIAANPAAFCLDVQESRTPEQIRTDALALGEKFPPLGAGIGWGGLGCAEWPVPAVMPREKLSAEGAPPILVVGTVSDPATPYEWAQALAGQLSSGRLLTWEGTQHTAYNQGSTCIDDAVETYLLTGDAPEDGTRCS